jgi:DNA-binding response OmpR family regulator
MSATGSILIVEDESVIAMLLRRILQQHGFEVVGPFGRLGGAMSALEERAVDLALLDVQIGSELVYPLAARLRERDTPFIFLTGHDALDCPPLFAGCARMTKPFRVEMLLSTIEAQLTSRRGSR